MKVKGKEGRGLCPEPSLGKVLWSAPARPQYLLGRFGGNSGWGEDGAIQGGEEGVLQPRAQSCTSALPSITQ